MSMREESRPLPKFGEWDVNNPASANGFTVIFERARDEKKSGAYTENARSSKKYDGPYIGKDKQKNYSMKRKWFCWG